EQASLQFTRVLGTSLARIADAAVALFIANVELPARARHASLVTLAQASLAAAEGLGMVSQTLEALLRAHLEAAIHRQRAARGDDRGDVVVMTVGFVDLV